MRLTTEGFALVAGTLRTLECCLVLPGRVPVLGAHPSWRRDLNPTMSGKNDPPAAAVDGFADVVEMVLQAEAGEQAESGRRKRNLNEGLEKLAVAEDGSLGVQEVQSY